MTIQTFSIEYDAINSRNTFTNGDSINGRIILEVSKETKVQSLVFIAQGKARVVWSEYHGQHNHRVYWADEKYYEVKQHILREARQDGNEIISKGRHVFPFAFKIPNRRIPSSFKDSVGKIVHKLKAELKQSMKLTKTTKVHFTFVAKDTDIPGLMDPQYGTKDKSLSVFGSGIVSMDVHTQRMGYKQGESLPITVEIVNNCSRSVKPKFLFYEKRSFFAQGHRKVHTKDILKDKIENLSSSSKETITKVISIPRGLPPSILNCSIIKLEYRLKLYLDIKYSSDPRIKLPIVVLPEAPETTSVKQLTPAPPAAAGAAAAGACGYGFMPYGNQNPPTWGPTPQQAASQPWGPPPPYAAYLPPPPAYAVPPSVPYPDKSSYL